MRVLGDPYRFDAHERRTLLVLGAVGLYVVTHTCWPAVARHTPLMCLVRRLTGLHCPGCGLTRACGCLLCLDLIAAVRYNPLVLWIASYLGYRTLEILVGMVTRRTLVGQWPAWFVAGYQGTFVGVGLVLTTIRLVTWLYPDGNPGGLGLPPGP